MSKFVIYETRVIVIEGLLWHRKNDMQNLSRTNIDTVRWINRRRFIQPVFGKNIVVQFTLDIWVYLFFPFFSDLRAFLHFWAFFYVQTAAIIKVQLGTFAEHWLKRTYHHMSWNKCGILHVLELAAIFNCHQFWRSTYTDEQKWTLTGFKWTSKNSEIRSRVSIMFIVN